MNRQAVVRIYASELYVMLDEMAQYPEIETGGDLLGLWSHGDTPTIFLASRPGGLARRERMSFQQDVISHRRVEKYAWERFGVQCVGMWHSHHKLGMEVLSRGDLGRTMRYARRSHRDRFVDVLGFFDEQWVLRPFLYLDPGIGRTQATRLEVLPGVSPLRAQLQDAPAALRGPPHGPVVRWSTRASEPQTPVHAPIEGKGDLDPASLEPPKTPARGPWRAIDAVERIVGEVVPPALMPGMELDVLDDHRFALRLAHRRGRTLVAIFEYDGNLRLDAWQVLGDRPVVGDAANTDVRATLKCAVDALEHG